MTRVAYRSSSTKLNEGKIERREIKRFKWGSQGSLLPELKGDEMRSNGRIWTHQAMCLLSPGCRRGTRCLAVLCMNPHPGMDRYRLIFSLGSVQVVPVSYIALHLSYTESGVENNFLLQESSGSRGQRRKNSDEGEKEILPSPVATSGRSPCSALGAGARGVLSSHEGLTARVVGWPTVHLSTQVSVWGPLAFCKFPLDSQGAWRNLGIWEQNPSIIPLI